MRKTILARVGGFVFTLLLFAFLSSCINDKYEISEENLDLKVTVFQEGVSVPLGSTAPVRLGDLVESMGEGSLDSLLSVMDGAYMFKMADTLTFTKEIAEALGGIGALKSISLDQNISFSLGNIDLSGLSISMPEIKPAPVNISEMLEIPDINSYLPEVTVALPEIKASVPAIGNNAFDLDLSSMNQDRSTVIVSFPEDDRPSKYITPLLNLFPQYADYEMNYGELTEFVKPLGVNLPVMKTEFRFDPVSIEFPLRLTLPKEIKSVEQIKLDSKAAIELIFAIQNSLFTSGDITPHLDVDIHNLFHIDMIQSGIGDGGHLEDVDKDGLFEQHVIDNFVMTPVNDWKADHIYHIDALALAKEDWKKQPDGRLVLDKTIVVTLSGDLKDDGSLKTTLRHLKDHADNDMSINMQLLLHNISIDDVVVEIEPIKVEQSKEIPLEMGNVTLPDFVKQVEYVALDPKNPLNIKMQADVPSICDGLDISLKTLQVEFPQGLVIDGKSITQGTYDETTRTLLYENVSLTEGLDEAIVIDRLDFPEMSGSTLSYSGQVKVKAEAVAAGRLSAKKLMQEQGGDIKVDVGVDFKPQLSDYSIVISDYLFDVEKMVSQFPSIKEPLGKEVGEMLNGKSVSVSLQQDKPGENQKIVISLNYPDPADDESLDFIQILPDAVKGLKIDFPDLIRFAPNSLEGMNYNESDNSITFAGDQKIPKEIVLEIEKIIISPEYSEAEDNYFIKDNMSVSGGVRLVGTTITMGDIKTLQSKNLQVSFSAVIPRLAPAEVGLDEYQISIPEEEYSIGKIELEMPEMIKSISVSDLLLKDVFLNLEMDLSSIVDLLGKNAKLNVAADVTLPAVLNMQGLDEVNRLSINESPDSDGKIVIGPLQVYGLDLSGVKIADGKLTVVEQKVKVGGLVKVEDIAVDMEKLNGTAIEIPITGGLATMADGKMTQSIEIDRIVGNVGLEVEPMTTSVDLSSISGILNGDNLSATVDINRYWLTLNVATNIDIPVKGNMNIVPYYGETPGTAVPVQVEMDPAKRVDGAYKFFISNKNPNAQDADGSLDAYRGYSYIPLDLIDILYKDDQSQKPVTVDSLQISFSAGVDPSKTCVIEPMKDYELVVDYGVGLPLELGKNFAVEYRDTIAGLPEIAGQLLKYGSVGIGGEVTSSLPMRLELQVYLLDSQMQRIPMKNGSGRLIIGSCDANGNAVTTPLDFVLSGIGTDMSDLYAVELILTADSKLAAGVAIGPDSSVQVKLNARVPEGVTVDLGELMPKEEDEEDNQ